MLRSGMLHHRDSAIASEQSFAHPKWVKTDMFWDALSYLVAKGIDELVPKTLTASASQGSRLAGKNSICHLVPS